MRSFQEDDEMESARRHIAGDRREREEEINYRPFLVCGDEDIAGWATPLPKPKRLTFLQRLRIRIAAWWWNR